MTKKHSDNYRRGNSKVMEPLGFLLLSLADPLAILYIFAEVSLILLPLAALAEQEIRTEQPAICLGYRQDTESWGAVGVQAYLAPYESNCPSDTAFVAVERIGGPERDPRHIPILGSCCPVPKDLLTDTHVFSEQACPKDSVATGTKTVYTQIPAECLQSRPRQEQAKSCSEPYFNALQLMRCTRINTKRYRLGTPRRARLWGVREHLSHWSIPHVQRAAIPAAIRHAIGRKSRFTWHANGCIGYPFGSLLTEKQGKRCELQFRQVLFAGQSGDPQDVPVPMFPACSAVSDRFDPDARCVE